MQIQRLTQPVNALLLALVLGGSWALGSSQESSRRLVPVRAEAHGGGGPGTEGFQVNPVNLPGAVPIGTVVAHVLDQPGAASLAVIRELGFAVCNGTTPAFQGIDDAVMAGATPDLNDSGRFLRGADPGYTGQMQDDATDKNGLYVGITDNGHDHMTMISDFLNDNNGDYGGFKNSFVWAYARRTYWDQQGWALSGLYHTASSASNVSASIGSTDQETRPTNMSVLWIMRVK